MLLGGCIQARCFLKQASKVLVVNVAVNNVSFRRVSSHTNSHSSSDAENNPELDNFLRATTSTAMPIACNKYVFLSVSFCCYGDHSCRLHCTLLCLLHSHYTPGLCVCVRHGETSLKRRKTETESEYGWRLTPSSVQRQLKSLPMDE